MIALQSSQLSLFPCSLAYSDITIIITLPLHKHCMQYIYYKVYLPDSMVCMYSMQHHIGMYTLFKILEYVPLIHMCIVLADTDLK